MVMCSLQVYAPSQRSFVREDAPLYNITVKLRVFFVVQTTLLRISEYTYILFHNLIRAVIGLINTCATFCCLETVIAVCQAHTV